MGAVTPAREGEGAAKTADAGLNVSVGARWEEPLFPLWVKSRHSALRFTPGFGATATVNISDFGPVGIFFRDDHNLSGEVKLIIDAIFDKM